MRTNRKEIEYLVDLHCNSIHFAELEKLLEKLDHEDLDVLRAMLEEVYDAGNSEACYRVEQRCEEHYNKGYSDGYSDGFSTEE